MNQYDHEWKCRNDINCGADISDQSEEDGELCQDCYDELEERENRFAGLVAENVKLKEELAAYKNANDPMGGGLRSLEWRFVWHGSGGNENWNRRGGRIFTNLTNGDELLYVGENKSDLDDAELLIAKHNADLLFVAQSKQAQIDRLKEALTGMVNHESAANAREGLEPSMELQFAQEVLGLVKLTGITKKEIDFQKYKKLIESEINVLGLNTRPYKILKAHGINTVRELARLTAIDLLKMPSMGRANFKNVTQQLEKHGLKLPDRSVQP